MTVLETDRLILRHWHAADRLPFAEMNADPRVMEFMPATLSRPESDLLLDKIEKHIKTHGFGLLAAELRGDRSLIGFIGRHTFIPDPFHTLCRSGVAIIVNPLG
jgi:RimJ/RimL family protein N-acetyltransferase